MRKIYGILAVACALSAISFAPKPKIVSNPYEGIDWNSVLQLKAGLHVHTCNSQLEWGPSEGTTVTPAQQIDRYTELGYDVLALTDHDHISFPWAQFDRADSRLVAIQGNELSKNDNMVSLFNDYIDHPGEGPDVSDGFYGCIEGVSARAGIIYLAHPMRNSEICKADTVIELLRRYPCVYGMEVLNVGQFEKNKSIALWDEVLSVLMPARPVYGSSSDDAHSTGMAGKGWTTLLTSARTPLEVRRALTTGTTFFSTPLMVKNPSGPVPGIRAINVDAQRGIIKITATDTDTIEWVSMGRIVATGDTFRLSKTPEAHHYVRAVLTGKGGQTFTQAWGIE